MIGPDGVRKNNEKRLVQICLVISVSHFSDFSHTI